MNEVILLFNHVHIIFKCIDARNRIQTLNILFLSLGATSVALRVKTILLIIIFVQECSTRALILRSIFGVFELLLEWFGAILVIN